MLQVVVFSGGRGSGALVRSLVSNPGLSVTVAINGYDDGASTGEVRRFLGDCLGPSDFRKNASRLARELGTCDADTLDLLDRRLPTGISACDAMVAIDDIHDPPQIAACLSAFRAHYQESGKPFAFSDCSLGNLVFAGAFLRAGRSFNAAVADYCELLNLPAGLVQNVTDGTNAYLVGVDDTGRILRSEEEIVEGRRKRRVKGIFLLDRPLADDEAKAIEGEGAAAAWQALLSREPAIGLNPALRNRIASADIILYAPGTQHSSLFPSYMTPGLADAIAANLRAIKLLVTNLQPDSEISGSTAVDLVERAFFYLNLHATHKLPDPCLITHYLLNEPGKDDIRPYVPLGSVESIDDPRLVRIGSYEDGVTGQHDAARVIGPFMDALTSMPPRRRLAILLHDGQTANKVTQTLLEMVRGGIESISMVIAVYYLGGELLDAAFVRSFPLAVMQVANASEFATAVRETGGDYVGLFESSGMYRGEDFVALASHLSIGRLDAIWGSRRLSVRDIQESYRVRYRRNTVLGAVSYFGSYMLSLACLLFYGRYVSDTLSGVRVVRTEYALNAGIDLTDSRINHYLLSELLRDRADLLELPVRFVPLSPEKVKRPGVLDGLRSLMTIVARRFARRDTRHRVGSPSTSAASGGVTANAGR